METIDHKFSLLVPCYNASKYIVNFLENIKLQEKSFDEILFYDDASTDNTVELLEKYQCKIIRGSSNMGPSTARNKLAENTTCNWFHFHDIDDFLNSQYLKKVSEIADNNQVDVVLCNVDWYDHNKKDLAISWKYSNSLINENALEYTLLNPIGGINGLYKKDVFKAIGGFNENVKMWEDADLHIRLAASNAKFYVTEEVLAFAIRYPNSLSTNQHVAWKTRYDLLQAYSLNDSFKLVRLTIGAEAQRASSALLTYGDTITAKKCLYLSESCGLQVPNSDNVVWKILKRFFLPKLRVELRIIQLRRAFKHHLNN